MFSRKIFANQTNIVRNLKITCRSISFLNKNNKLLGVQRGKSLTASNIFKLLGKQSLFHWTPACGSKHIYSRRIHNFLPDSNKTNQRKEDIKNYLFLAVLGGICLAMFLFSMTMRTHEDYVYINPPAGKK